MGQKEFKSARVQYHINDGSDKGGRLALANLGEKATSQGLTLVKNAIERLIPHKIDEAVITITETLAFD